MKQIIQRDFKDCGVTCLEYMIEFYRGYVPIETLREDTLTNQEGTSAYHLVETLKKYQFDSYGIKTTIENLKKIYLPAIAHVILQNGMNHFIVITKISDTKITIMDPSYGKRILSKIEFEHIWDGIILLAIPKGMIPRLPKPKSIFTHLFCLAKKEKRFFKIIFLFSFLIALLSMITSFYLKIGMQYVFVLEAKELHLLILSFGSLFLLKMIFQYIQNIFFLHLDKNLNANYLFLFVTHLLKLPIPKFQSYQEGELWTRIDEASEVKDLFLNICVTFASECFLGLAAFLFLSFIEWHMALMLFLGMLCYVILGLLLSKPYYHIVLEELELKKKWNEMILEKIRMFLTMKHFHQTPFIISEYEDALCQKQTEMFQKKRRELFFQTTKDYFMEGLFFALMTYGIILVGKSLLTIYDFLTFQSLYFYFITPLKELADVAPKYYYMKGILSKLSETMSLKEEELKKVDPIAPPSIVVKDFSYSYNDVVNQIENINFKVKAKEHVFLSGPSGCGKSTICKILEKEMDGYLGKITLSNKDLEDYSLSEIRSSIVYLSQNETILSGTIKENILFGQEETKEFDEVCEICELESVVAKKPFRYESSINDLTISGGERQRILLARALLKPASLYLFDEVLSEVNEELEIKIIRGLRKKLKGKTVIYISHKDHAEEFERRISFVSKKSRA